MILINLLPHREAARKRRREAFFVDVVRIAGLRQAHRLDRQEHQRILVGCDGGIGDGGGGGGAGLGAGLFVNQAGASVTLTNVRFVNCSAVGGAGGNFQSMTPDRPNT